MKVLITGGGFLGIRLGQALSAAGHGLRYLDIAPAPLPGLDWRLGDVSSPLAVSRALEGCSHVVHLAALLTPACAADPHRGAQVNLIGTLNVFEAARRSGLKHVVYASSAGVYGPDDATQPRPTTLYGTWKLACEGLARAYHAGHGIGSVALRPFVVYGAGREVGMSAGPSLACRAAANGMAYAIPFSGRTGLVYVDDVVRAFASALMPRMKGAFVFDMPGVVAAVDEFIAELRRQVPGADVTAQGVALPSAADIAQPDMAPVLGAQPVTSLADGITATLAALRGGDQPGSAKL